MILTMLAALAMSTSLDTTFAVAAGARLRVEASAGRIEIRTWDRNFIQLKAVHAPAVVVHLVVEENLISVWGSGRGRRMAEVVYTLTIPRSMGMTLGSGDVEISVHDTRAEVIAKNYSGRITVTGGRGVVSARSTLGEVSVSGADGRITAESSEATVRVSDVKGDLDAMSSSSHVYLSGIDSRTVAASTVGGVITFSGRLHDDGNYSFVAHDGSVTLAVSEATNALLSISTLRGGFACALRCERREGTRRGQFTARLGTGAATVEVQTFSGGIVVKRLELR